MDQILQESVAYYDPAMHVIVFVFLPSESGNSMAIWRRKIAVPNNVRLAYQPHIKQALAALRKKYVLHVDEYVLLHKLIFLPADTIRLLQTAAGEFTRITRITIGREQTHTKTTGQDRAED